MPGDSGDAGGGGGLSSSVALFKVLLEETAARNRQRQQLLQQQQQQQANGSLEEDLMLTPAFETSFESGDGDTSSLPGFEDAAAFEPLGKQ